MSEMMEFPKTVDEFMESYKIVDTEQVYTNGAELVPIFRMQQWFEHLSTADVRPVVTCGKCKYGKYTGTSWFCDKHSGHADKFGEDASYHEYHGKHWFCADGEERNHA